MSETPEGFLYSNSPTKLREMIQVGNKLKIDYGKNNFNTKIIHIRAVIDDWQVVYSSWSKRKQYYKYYIESVYSFFWDLEEGRLKYVGKDKEEKQICLI